MQSNIKKASNWTRYIVKQLLNNFQLKCQLCSNLRQAALFFPFFPLRSKVESDIIDKKLKTLHLSLKTHKESHHVKLSSVG